ncbi:energy-coupling factor transport system permease protein [Phytomonospora endophytica]|uniref:Energy-coupling factor transport system permease protein n=2 Tax=Phytomonospora endophytica TaxID=714109 RepID=A0A841FKK3_9ACTN|nr:energy-coupling factor transport system permease protein [Phytomonospora endophytica]
MTAPAGRIARRNPAAKLGVVAVISIAAVTTTDPLTPSILLAAELLALPFCGIRLGVFFRRCRLLLFGAVSVTLVNALFAAEQGPELIHLGPLRIGETALFTGAALGLRMLAVAVPGVVVFATTDPTDLADSLVQQLRAPARFAIGALAAFRMLPLLAAEWELITMARRARGVDAGADPVARGRLFASTMFALLVGAIRRGTRLATAMDARGFDAGTPRTIARPQRMRTADWALLGAATVVAAGAVAVSVAAGTFQALFA